jgi:predicted permease
MRSLWRDVRFGLRGFQNSPGFTAVAVLTLALGLAVNTTVFSWIDALLLNPLPGVGASRELLHMESVTTAGEYLVNLSFLDYRDYRDNLKLVSGLAVARHTPLSVGSAGEIERAWGELVSGNFFDVLRIKPILGRTFLPEESGDKPAAYPMAVISHRMWQRRFGGDPGVLGKTIRLNRRELTIVGVAPPEFRGTRVGLAYDVWAPITMAVAMGTGSGTLNYRGTRDITSTFVRLKPGVTLEQARAEVAALARRLEAAYPTTNRGIGATLTPVWRSHSGAQALLLGPLQILMAVCGLLLLIVCANVANLLLARAVSRQKEFSIRLALGAGRLRLARQLLTETLLLAGAGGLIGAFLAVWMARTLVALLPPTDAPIALDAGLSFNTLGFTLLVSLLATLISGTAPALLSVRTELSESLKAGGRGGGSGAHSHRLRGLLVVCEVALASVALVGAGLFLKSFRNASAIHPGFDMSNVSISQFYLSYSGYSAEEQRQFCRTLRERLEAAPGVIGVSYSDHVPLAFGSSPYGQLEVEGHTPTPNEDMNIHRSMVPPGHFNLMRIPLLEGRDFTELDEAAAPPVMIVNQNFARRFFAGRSPLGRKVRRGAQSMTVVGVVKDSKYHRPTEAPLPYFYMPFRQVFAPGLNFAVFVKTAGDPLRVSETLRREALALNPDAICRTTRLSEASTAALYPQKVAAILLGVLGAASVFLAAIGLYSVMSYAVSQRTQELGVRMALGARPADVLALVVRQALTMALPGLGAGLVAALAASRLVAGVLVNMSPADPLAFAGTAVFLTLIALLACLVPALRATRLDPMTALRFQ